MKKKIILFILFIFVFCFGFLVNSIYIQIKKNYYPFFLKWGYNDKGNLDWYSFGDKNGLAIMGSYNSDGLETFIIIDEKKDYKQFTVFGKTYSGSIDNPTPPIDDEIIQIDSFLTRTEKINNYELQYYIDNSELPKIIFSENVETIDSPISSVSCNTEVAGFSSHK